MYFQWTWIDVVFLVKIVYAIWDQIELTANVKPMFMAQNVLFCGGKHLDIRHWLRDPIGGKRN